MLRTITAALAALTLGTTGCSVLERQLPEEVPNADRTRTGVLKVDAWGVTDGLLSVRVQNDSSTVLEQADATMIVELETGQSVSARGSVDQDLCCTLLDVPPGEDFGLYVDLGERAEEVTDVEVTYSNVSWGSQDDLGPTTELTIDEPELLNTLDDTRVRTSITASEDVETIAAQVFLDGPDGEFLAVVSGRFRCFEASEPRDVVLELYHPVPAGTEVESIVAYPLTATIADAPADCG